jgi:outer membrane protein OmpA-like peptidoglycan-associated protein
MLNKTAAASLLVALGLLSRGAWADERKSHDATKTSKHVAESKIFFEFDSDQLSADSRAELDKAARWIKSKKTGLILIEGHTDKVGGASYNKELGERRGRATREYLIAQGVPEARIRILSYGEGLPARDTDERAEENRRIVLFAVQKEPIIEKRTDIVEVEVPVKERVYVDRARDPLGVQLMVGGGLTNQLDDETDEVTELGGLWDARVAFFNRSFVGFEAAYVGTVQTVNALGLDDNAQLLGNGAEANLRLNFLRGGMVRPYAFGGVGWTHYDLTNTETAAADVEDNDDVVHIPAGLGIGFNVFRGVTLDLRGTVRAAFEDETFEPMAAADDEMGLENWSTSAQLGFEF